MKAVLISIQPKWVEKIASGQKTIEVRKNWPKLDKPFKCYIYCSQGTYKDLGNYCDWVYENRMKVIGEFVCDRIEEWKYFPDCYVEKENEKMYYITSADGYATCLNYDEIENYGKGKTLYGWHISNLKIYDKPKELSEFWTVKCTNKRNGCIGCEVKPNCIKTVTRPPQSWCYVEAEE